VTNDCAERGVKIINDFKDVTEDEEQLQYALLSCRKKTGFFGFFLFAAIEDFIKKKKSV
jgi:hypothetical protein